MRWNCNTVRLKNKLTMSASDANESVSLPTFNGKEEAFQVWWTKFKAFATAKGFIAVLTGKEKAELPLIED